MMRENFTFLFDPFSGFLITTTGFLETGARGQARPRVEASTADAEIEIISDGGFRSGQPQARRI
jgi:hypothetical protein